MYNLGLKAVDIYFAISVQLFKMKRNGFRHTHIVDRVHYSEAVFMQLLHFGYKVAELSQKHVILGHFSFYYFLQ